MKLSTILTGLSVALIAVGVNASEPRSAAEQEQASQSKADSQSRQSDQAQNSQQTNEQEQAALKTQRQIRKGGAGDSSKQPITKR